MYNLVLGVEDGVEAGPFVEVKLDTTDDEEIQNTTLRQLLRIQVENLLLNRLPKNICEKLTMTSSSQFCINQQMLTRL